MFKVNRSVPHTVLLCGLAPTHEDAAKAIPSPVTGGRQGTMNNIPSGDLGETKLQPLAALQTLYLTKSVASVAFGKFHCAVVTTSGDLYTWGMGANGVLGHGDTEDLWQPERVGFGEPDIKVASVACGDTHTLALTNEQMAYGWGGVEHFESGHESKNSKECVTSPRLIAGLAGHRFVQVLAENNYSGAISVDGKFYTWGSGEYSRLGNPSLRSAPGNPVDFDDPSVKIVCGMLAPFHAGAVTEEGKLYCWGMNTSGAVGVADKSNKQPPTLVSGLADERITKVDGGRHFTIALAESGRVYSWGKNNCGQLGIMSNSRSLPQQRHPTLVRGALETAHIADISCGLLHSVAVAADGRCFTWGNGTYGQTGHGSREDIPQPTELTDVRLPGLGSVMCGMYLTAVLASSMDSLEGMFEPAAEGDAEAAPLIAVPKSLGGAGAMPMEEDDRMAQVLEIQGNFQSLGVTSPVSTQNSDAFTSGGPSQPNSMNARTFEPVNKGAVSTKPGALANGIQHAGSTSRLSGGIDQLENKAQNMVDQVSDLSSQLGEKTRELDNLREQEQQEIRRMLNEQKELETKLAAAKADEEQVESLKEGISIMTQRISQCVALNERLSGCTTAAMANQYPDASYSELLSRCNAEIDTIQMSAEKLRSAQPGMGKDDENVLLDRLASMVIDSAKTKRAYTEKEAILNAETAKKEDEFKQKHNTPPKMPASPLSAAPGSNTPNGSHALPHVEKKRMSFGSPKMGTSPKLASTTVGSPKMAPTSKLQDMVKSGKVKSMGTFQSIHKAGSRSPGSPGSPDSKGGQGANKRSVPPPLVKMSSKKKLKRCHVCSLPPPCKHNPAQPEELLFDGGAQSPTKEVAPPAPTSNTHHTRDQCQTKCIIM